MHGICETIGEKVMDICVQDITKAYGEKSVLSSLNLYFKEKEITCIMAPSGFGKTTLLNCMMGLEMPDTGEIKGMPGRFSAVFQEDRLCEQFSALTNIQMVCGNHVTKDLIGRHLEEAGLFESSSLIVSKMSGGMKRRIAIVRAIIAEGELVILDEPFKGMDTDTRIRMINYIKRHQNKRSILIVTHNAQDAELLGGRLAILDVQLPEAD